MLLVGEKCGMTSIYWLLRPYFFPVIPSCFFICHSGLRAGVQVNIDSSATWIPGQARNDRKKNEPGMTEGRKRCCMTEEGKRCAVTGKN